MAAIAFLATAWGPRHGGVNAFNADLCAAVAALGDRDLRVICFVLDGTDADVAAARACGVTLVSLAAPSHAFEQAHAHQLRDEAESWGDVLWWIGHDIYSGPAAVAAGRLTGRPAAVIQHTHYVSYGVAPRAIRTRRHLLVEATESSQPQSVHR